MNTCAIITEYNPLHLGHKHLHDAVRNAGYDCIVAIQSGNYVQRGEPAIYNKYDRAKDAVQSGVDLVLEMPFPYCISGAKYFASAGINIINKLGIKNIFFGSECGDKNALKTTVQNLLDVGYQDTLAKALEAAKNSPKSDIVVASEVYQSMYSSPMPNTANDMLAVEYIKAIYNHDFDIDFDTIKRANGYSATSTRSGINNCDNDIICHNVGASLCEEYSTRQKVTLDMFSSTIFSALLGKNRERIEEYADLESGIAGLLYANLPNAKNLSELVELCSTKKYTNARIRRAVFNAYFGITREQMEDSPLYTTLLAANEKGCEFLHSIKKTAAIEIVTKPADINHLSLEAKVQYERALEADKTWEIVAGNGIGSALRHTSYIERT